MNIWVINIHLDFVLWNIHQISILPLANNSIVNKKANVFVLFEDQYSRQILSLFKTAH